MYFNRSSCGSTAAQSGDTKNSTNSEGNESPSSFAGNAPFPDTEPELPNEISAPYEVPQFPIEQIEKKLQIQRQLTTK
ncbi:hypothetical protein YQE_05298, partial [Dendroctonus ponderosae]